MAIKENFETIKSDLITKLERENKELREAIRHQSVQFEDLKQCYNDLLNHHINLISVHSKVLKQNKFKLEIVK